MPSQPRTKVKINPEMHVVIRVPFGEYVSQVAFKHWVCHHVKRRMERLEPDVLSANKAVGKDVMIENRHPV
jgi:hypothetical protein